MNRQDMPEGLDVANYQGYPNWGAVKAAGFAFAFIKATEGVHYVNETFAPNIPRIRAAQLYPGFYHFGRPDLNLPEPEADYFVDTVMLQAGLEVGDILALDIEDLNGSLSRAVLPVGEWTLRFLQHVERRVGFAPLCYVNAGVAQEHHFDRYPSLANYGLWLAAWTLVLPDAPAPWELVAFWQDGIRTASGVAGEVDHDLFNGPADRIPLYGKPGGTPLPTDPCAEVRKELDALKASQAELVALRDALRLLKSV